MTKTETEFQVDQPALEAPETLPTTRSVESHLLNTKLDIAQLERTLDSERFHFMNRQISGGNVSDELHDTYWKETLPGLREKESAVLAELNALKRTIVQLHRLVEGLNSGEVVPADIFGATAPISTFVASETNDLTGEQLTVRLTAITGQNDPAQVLARRMATRNWLEAIPVMVDPVKLSESLARLEQSFVQTIMPHRREPCWRRPQRRYMHWSEEST
jgi:hypothetical protein